MKFKKINPITPGTRHQVNLSKNLLSKKNNLFKNLTFKIKTCAGRSSQSGNITVRHKGGGCKKKFRSIKFCDTYSQNLILFTNYDPYRNAFVSLSFDLSNFYFYYMLSVQTIFPGAITSCDKNKLELYFGNRSNLANFPLGSLVHNVSLSLKNENKINLSRSAGTYCQLVQKKGKYVHLKLPSGKFLRLSFLASATLGRVSNFKVNLTAVGKAGKNRLKGIRPTVRGVAMNPVDHPHGGRTKGGRPSVTP